MEQASNAAYTILRGVIIVPAWHAFSVPINRTKSADLLVGLRFPLGTLLKVNIYTVDDLLWDQRLNLWLVALHHGEEYRVLGRERGIQVLQKTLSIGTFQAVY